MLFLCGHGLEFWFEFFDQFLFGFGTFGEGVVDDFRHFVTGHRAFAVVFSVFVALDDAVASEFADGFISPVVFRDIREVFGHIRIDDRKEGIEAAGEIINLFLLGFFPFCQAVRGIASCLIATLADTEEMPPPYMFSPVPKDDETLTMTFSFGR